MNTVRIRSLVLLAAFASVALPPVSSQTATDLNMGATMSVGDTDPLTWRFSWWGQSGRHYLVQVSIDLQTWSFLPATNPSGADAPITVVVPFDSSSTEPKLFFRAIEFRPSGSQSPELDSDGNGLLDGWEIAFFGATGAASTGDADNDGVSNLDEYLTGRDPTRSAAIDGANSTVALRLFDFGP